MKNNDGIETLKAEDRAKIEAIRAQVNSAIGVLADLQRGWNHGAKLMEATADLFHNLNEARRSADELS